MRSTQDKIRYLLLDIEILEASERSITNIGAHERTNAGMNFFLSQHRELMNKQMELCKYPYQWIEAVRTLDDLERRGVQGRVPTL